MKQAKKMLGVLSLGFLYSSMWLLPYIKYVFYDAIIEVTGFSHTQVGLILSIYMVSVIVFMFPSGWLADKFNPKKMIVASGIAQAVVSVISMFFITNFAITVVCFIVLGMTSILCYWSQSFKALNMVCKKEERGRYMGWFDGFNGLGSMIFNFVALAAFGAASNGSAGGLKAVYITYAAASLISALMVAFFYHEEQGAEEESGSAETKKIASTKEILAVLKMPKVWIFSVMVFGIYGFYCGSSFLTPYFSTVLGVSVVFSGTLATLKNYGTRFIGSPIAGAISDKIGRLKFISWGVAITVVLMIAFMLMPASPSALVPIMVLMFALAIVNVSTKGIYFSATNELGVSEAVNGMTIAVATQIGHNIPDVALHPIFGMILDHNEPVAAYKIIFACLLGMLVLALLMCLLLLNMRKKDAAKAAAAEQAV